MPMLADVVLPPTPTEVLLFSVSGWAWGEWLLLLLGLLSFMVYAQLALDYIGGYRLLQPLETVDLTKVPEHWPSVAIIIPCCNEETTVEAALNSVLTLDYPSKKIVVINDRSTDQTGTILNQLAQSHPELTVEHLTTLPPGWLGKNHALQWGADHTDSEFLLFTDADVQFHPQTLKAAMIVAHQQQLDHVAIAPAILQHGFWYNVVVSGFTYFFNFRFRPWHAQNPRKPQYIGIGAFNLIRRSTYQAVEGHQPIRLHTGDDVKLGELIKQSGYRQAMLVSHGWVAVDWYSSVQGYVEGLMKNTFSFMNYSVPQTVLTIGAQLAFFVWPYLALIVCRGPLWWINLGVVLLITLTVLMNGIGAQLSRWTALLFFVPASLMCYILGRSMWLVLQQGGVIWRGTLYPLDELRAFHRQG